MKKNSLSKNGLSLSQAQSVSNLCNQKALEIAANLATINNVTKSIELVRNGQTTDQTILKGNPIPADIVEILKLKATLHACQAFLMENIKAKDEMLKNVKKSSADFSVVPVPTQEPLKTYTPIANVDEDFGWSELSTSEMNEFYEAEAMAAHIGQFIHNKGILATLREELPNIKPIEWMVIKDGEKTPIFVTEHHTSDELIALHEKLAKLHREYEQKVNYFKAKVKNLTTLENARIANINADNQTEVEKFNNEVRNKFNLEYNAYQERIKTVRNEFEKERQAKIGEISALRIDVDARYQPIVDMFITK